MIGTLHIIVLMCVTWIRSYPLPDSLFINHGIGYVVIKSSNEIRDSVKIIGSDNMDFISFQKFPIDKYLYIDELGKGYPDEIKNPWKLIVVIPSSCSTKIKVKADYLGMALYDFDSELIIIGNPEFIKVKGGRGKIILREAWAFDVSRNLKKEDFHGEVLIVGKQ